MKKNKLYIAIVLPSIITKNGTAKQSLELAKVLKKLGNNVVFYTFAYHKDLAFPEFSDFKIHYCFNAKKSIISKLTNNAAALETIYLYLAIIMIFKFRKLFAGKIIDVYNTHDWFGLWVVKRRSNLSKIIANINDVPLRSHGIINRIKLHIDKKMSKQINRVLVLDEVNKKKVEKWLNISHEKIIIVRSGIDVTLYKNFKKTIDIRETFNLPKNSYVFSCANLLARNRRYEDAIKALALIKKRYNKKFYLFILSKLDFDYKYADYLKKIVQDFDLESQVFFIDKFFSNDERMMYIKSCDALVFPNYPQTWGLTVLEAMALGVPVIVSDGSGVSEVLHDGTDSLVYKRKNVDELAEKMIDITSLKKSNYIKNKARNYVFDNFTWEKYGNEVNRIMISS